MAPGPTADFDNDGRLDMFLPSWWPERRSLLLRNETTAGHWLQVSGSPVGAAGVTAKTADATATESPAAARRVNRQRIGTRIELYAPGRMGDPTAMLGCRELSVGFGYASAQPAIAHFGLGTQTTVDVRFVAPHGGPVRELRDVRADQRIAVLP
jgi:hypothetical protein